MKVEKYLNEASGRTATDILVNCFRQGYKGKPGSKVEEDFEDSIVYITEIGEEEGFRQGRSISVTLGKKIGDSEAAWYDSDDLIPV